MMCTVDNDNNNNNMGAGGFLGMAGEGTHTVSQCDLYSRSIPVQALSIVIQGECYYTCK